MKKWFLNHFQLVAAAAFFCLAGWAGKQALAQTSSDQGDRPRVMKFTYVKSKESCIDVFARLDEKVSISDCIKAAERVGIDVMWYRPDITKPPTYILNIHPGDKVGVYVDGDKKTMIIFPREHVRNLSHPIAQ